MYFLEIVGHGFLFFGYLSLLKAYFVFQRPASIHFSRWHLPLRTVYAILAFIFTFNFCCFILNNDVHFPVWRVGTTTEIQPWMFPCPRFTPPQAAPALAALLLAAFLQSISLIGVDQIYHTLLCIHHQSCCSVQAFLQSSRELESGAGARLQSQCSEMGHGHLTGIGIGRSSAR